MKIMKLRMNSFGKFTDKTLEFTPGLNIVSGGNEAGKSTLHKFIGAMFFGMYKQGKKNKLSSEDYLKYFPWYGENYGGSLMMEAGGDPITIVRNFRKNSEKVSIINEASGEDITESFPYDPVAKLPDTSEILGINRYVFENTVSISQMSSATGQALAGEISEMIVNTSLTFTPGVSYRNALNTLSERREKIGTKTQSKTPRGKAEIRLNQLTEELKAAEQIKAENAERYAQIKKAQTELVKNDVRRRALGKKREMSLLAQYAAKYEKFKELTGTLNALQSEISAEIKINEQEYRRYLTCENMLSDAREEYDKLIMDRRIAGEQVASLAEKLEQLKSDKANGENSRADAAVFENAVAKLAEVKEQRRNDQQRGVLEEQYNKSERASRAFMFSFIGLILAAAVFVAIALIGGDKNFYTYSLIEALIGLPCAAGWIYFLTKAQNTRRLFDAVVKKSALEVAYREQIDAFLEKYEAADLRELNEIFDRAAGMEERISELNGQLAAAVQKEKSLMESSESVKAKTEHNSAIMASILRGASCGNSAELRAEYEKIRARDMAVAKHEATLQSAAALLGDMSEQQLQEKARQAQSMGIKPLEFDDYEKTLSEEERDIYEEATRINNQISSLNGAIESSSMKVREISEIAEDISSVKETIAALEEKYAALSDASESIMRVSADIKSDAAAKFNEYVSELLSGLTSGRYSRVFVGEDMEITVRDEQSGNMVALSELSGGTIDQCYFAVRFAVAQLIIPDKALPIFLDDCFVQYDEGRLFNILALLGKVAQSRQILLFTCRRTEQQLLDSLGVTYNLVNLGR
ncbi:MAG: AAA family ATPase [Eubacteriaceae bacterium]|nr:AAA family ATPase [Eubacteriaceae bacterium]